MTAESNDWRQTDQKAYLDKATFEHRPFTPPSDNPHWDHEHCSFCWAKFMAKVPDSDPTVMAEGYVSEDDHWVCDRCFDDFREEFEWTVVSPNDSV